MQPRYFQGTTVTGPVRASDARDFKEVVDALRIAPTIKMRQADFLALDEQKRNEVKKVPFFVPCTFHDSPSKRKTEHAVHCNLIFLDIDPLKEKDSQGINAGKWVETGIYPAAPFIENPSLLMQALKKFNFAAHVTASSTPLRPRMRVIVDAHEIPLSEYPKAVATIGALLGLPSITRESSVAVQPMFLPTLFHDSPIDYSPVIQVNLEGKPFTLSDISDSIDSYHGVNGHHKNGTNGSRPHEAVAHPDALDFLKAPVPEISLAVTKGALFKISPDVSRDEWLEMAAALKHQFSPHKDAEAFELFDEWSQAGDKYAGTQDTETRWRSLKPSPNGRLPITIRTLLRKAQEHGWNDKPVREDCFLNLLRWMEEAPSISDLMDHGVKKILATPLLTSMQEDMLVNQLCQQSRKRFSHPLSTTAVRKDIAKVREQVRQETEPQNIIKDAWATDVCYIIGADEFFRYRTGEKMKTAAFNAAYGRHLMPTKAQLLAAGTPLTPATESTPMALPSNYALHKLKIPTAQEYSYDPSQPNEKLPIAHGVKTLNIYQPTYPLLDHKNAVKAGKLFTNHLEHLIAEPEYRRTLIDFMAFQVQCPGRKIRWGVLLQSGEGAGKTFLAETMKAVLGPQHVRIIDATSIKSGWNEWCFGAQVVVLEEIRVVGTSKHELMNFLKGPIANVNIPINEKFRNTREVTNITNYFLLSNHHDALALTAGDRRYFVLKSPLQTKAQVLALGEDYFPPLFNMLRDFPGGLRAWFLDWEISPDFNPDGHAPRTTYAAEMVADSASDLHSAVRRLLIEADFPLVQYDIVSSGVLKTALIQQEGIERVSTQVVSQILREEGMMQRGRHLIGDERHYLWARPGMTEEVVIALAIERDKRQLKNLGMELLYL